MNSSTETGTGGGNGTRRADRERVRESLCTYYLESINIVFL
jgi:hypothetical protein